MRYIATLDGTDHEIELEETGADSFSIKFGDTAFQASLRRVGPFSFSILLDYRSFDLDVVRDGEEVVVTSRQRTTRMGLIDTARRRSSSARKREQSGRAEIKALMPGRVVNVLVAAGDEVQQGSGIMVLEAMKMENEIKAPKTGKVIEVKVAPGQTVEKGELMIIIE
jgi:biotin carboxyl carrier protein